MLNFLTCVFALKNATICATGCIFFCLRIIKDGNPSVKHTHTHNDKQITLFLFYLLLRPTAANATKAQLYI